MYFVLSLSERKKKIAFFENLEAKKNFSPPPLAHEPKNEPKINYGVVFHLKNNFILLI